MAVAVEYWAHLSEEAKAPAGSDCNLVKMVAEQQFAVEGHTEKLNISFLFDRGTITAETIGWEGVDRLLIEQVVRETGRETGRQAQLAMSQSPTTFYQHPVSV